MDLSKDFEAIQQKVDKLQKLADLQIEPPRKFEVYTKPDDSKYKWGLYDNDNMYGTFNQRIEYYFWTSNYWADKSITQEKLASVLSNFDKTLEMWKADNEDTLNKNKEVSCHNALQYSRVETIMSTLGVPATFYSSFYKTSRSRKMTTERRPAEWPKEIKGVLPTDCGYEAILKRISEKREAIKTFGENWIKDNEKRLREEEAVRLAKEKEAKEQKVLATLRVKYELDLDAEVDEIVSTIKSKCKYLTLAQALLDNRNDWNDGCDSAECGLSFFTIETAEDGKIYNEISGLCVNWGWEGDGRVFRDCKYNYDYLFGLVDETLMKDYNAAMEFYDES